MLEKVIESVIKCVFLFSLRIGVCSLAVSIIENQVNFRRLFRSLITSLRRGEHYLICRKYTVIIEQNGMVQDKLTCQLCSIQSRFMSVLLVISRIDVKYLCIVYIIHCVHSKKLYLDISGLSFDLLRRQFINQNFSRTVMQHSLHYLFSNVHQNSYSFLFHSNSETPVRRILLALCCMLIEIGNKSDVTLHIILIRKELYSSLCYTPVLFLKSLLHATAKITL